jgi:murein DD-endopeptidase MepM/ murein hydrolase activator NlpD
MGRHMGRHMAISLIALALLGGCIPQMGAPERDYPPPAPYESPGSQGQQQPYQPRRDDNDRYRPASPPAWVARPVMPDAQTIRSSTYIVQPGDTLRGIADRTGSGSEAIARANGLTAPFTLRAGQRLSIPGGRYHLVRGGETGIAIARAYGVDWSRVIALNDLQAPYTLRVGMRILIPTGPVTAGERAATFTLDVDDILTGGEPALAVNQRPTRPSESPSRILPPSAALAEPARLKSGFGWPARGNIVTRFGPGAAGEKFNGINIAVPLDSPILASADGVVAYAGNEVANLGGLVILKHGGGWTTVYGHANQLLVKRGQSVKKGQTIAMSGDSGLADRPELHFEIRRGRTPVDPLGQLPRR